MSDHVIQIKGVHKRFGARAVLNNVNLQVPRHSVFGFLGNNGAGKSTTIRIMLGLLEADAGEVLVLGREIRRHRIALMREVGCLVDAPALYPNLRAAEFLQLACKVRTLPAREIGRVLELVNLAGTGKALIGEFSLGMKQRMALAHALLGSPQLLVLDEPGNGLDPHGTQETRQLLKELPRNAGCTVFVSSHQLSEVERIASHIALLDGGAVVAQAPIADLMRARRGVLALDICNAARATTLLRKFDYDAHMTGERSMEVRHVAPDATDQLHAILFGAGVRLFQSVYRQPTLEQWFLDATNKTSQEPTKMATKEATKEPTKGTTKEAPNNATKEASQ